MSTHLIKIPVQLQHLHDNVVANILHSTSNVEVYQWLSHIHHTYHFSRQIHLKKIPPQLQYLVRTDDSMVANIVQNTSKVEVCQWLRCMRHTYHFPRHTHLNKIQLQLHTLVGMMKYSKYYVKCRIVPVSVPSPKSNVGVGDVSCDICLGGQVTVLPALIAWITGNWTNLDGPEPRRTRAIVKDALRFMRHAPREHWVPGCRLGEGTCP